MQNPELIYILFGKRPNSSMNTNKK